MPPEVFPFKNENGTKEIAYKIETIIGRGDSIAYFTIKEVSDEVHKIITEGPFEKVKPILDDLI